MLPISKFFLVTLVLIPKLGEASCTEIVIEALKDSFFNRDLKSIARIEAAIFSNPWGIEALTREKAIPNTRIFLARQGRKTVGYVTVRMFNGKVIIRNFAVEKSSIRQGIGTKILDFLQKKFPGRTIEHNIYIKNTMGIGFLRRYGFRVAKKSFDERSKVGDEFVSFEFKPGWDRQRLLESLPRNERISDQAFIQMMESRFGKIADQIGSQTQALQAPRQDSKWANLIKHYGPEDTIKFLTADTTVVSFTIRRLNETQFMFTANRGKSWFVKSYQEIHPNIRHRLSAKWLKTTREAYQNSPLRDL